MQKLTISAVAVAIGFAISGIPAAIAHEGEDHSAAAPAATAGKALPMVAAEVTKIARMSPSAYDKNKNGGGPPSASFPTNTSRRSR